MDCEIVNDGLELTDRLARPPGPRTRAPFPPTPPSDPYRPSRSLRVLPTVPPTAHAHTQAREPSGWDLILVDSAMGGGDRDGLPTVRRIAAMGDLVTAPVVVASGEGAALPPAAFLEAGAAKVLQKPTTLEMLQGLPALVRARQQQGGPGPAPPLAPAVGRQRSQPALVVAEAASALSPPDEEAPPLAPPGGRRRSFPFLLPPTTTG